jgi:DNA-binding response OmpR family regulator
MTKKILIAEDEVALSTALDLKLVRAGYEATVVSDGQQAIEAIAANSYDLVLLDLMMPKLDGFRALQQIRTSGQTVKVIVLSNLGQPDDIGRVAELGISGFYIKSDTPIINIVQKVKELIG